MLVPRAIGAAPGHPRAALALPVVRELSPSCTRGQQEVSRCAASVVCPRWRCLMLSLNVLGPASNGVAVLIDMRQIAARLLRCLGWGARHGSTRLPSSMETARMRLVEGSVLTTTWPARQTSERRLMATLARVKRREENLHGIRERKSEQSQARGRSIFRRGCGVPTRADTIKRA